MTKYGYARESTRRQELGLAAQVLELEKAGCDHILTDPGQSGAANLIESKVWESIASVITTGDELKVWSQSRLGRDNTEVAWVIGRLTKRGISIHVLEEGRIITDMDDFNQNATMTLKGLADHNERVEIKKRTKKALRVLKDAGVSLGQKPVFSTKQVAEIRRLHSLGIGYGTIAKLVPWKSADGKLHISDPRTVKAALSGSYVTSDVWEARNDLARKTMLSGGR